LKVEDESDVGILNLRFREWGRVGLDELAMRLRRLGDAVELVAWQTRFIGTANDAEDEFEVVLLCEDEKGLALWKRQRSGRNVDAPAYRRMMAFFSRLS
jgi:hypothetical protein